MPRGYNRKVLHVDLSSASIREEEASVEFYRKYMGGSALNLYYLLKQMPAGVDPLGPENILALSVRVFNGRRCREEDRQSPQRYPGRP